MPILNAMKSCYDGRDPKQSMRIHAFVVAAMVLVGSAEVAAEPGPWHAVVTPPRAGLPAVAIDLGYPGPYIPPLNAPITLRAAGSGAPFDGYIGFRFSVRGSRTFDTPVTARARLQRGSAWTFSTFANMKRCCIGTHIPREIEIEWRDRGARRIASVSAGVPPWAAWEEELLPLRVVAAGEESVPPTVLGRSAVVMSAAALPARAQWYAGFSTIVVPLATWLDLHDDVRTSMFASAVPLVFVGFPGAGQQLDAITRAALPVVFHGGAAAYVAPWPYGVVRRDAPLSWTAKEGAGRLGPAQNPYLARTTAAAWMPDDAALSRPLPLLEWAAPGAAVRSAALKTYETSGLSLSSIPLLALPRVFAGAVATLIALLLAISAWLLLRRKPRLVVAAAVVLAAGLLVAARSRVRPAASVKEEDVRLPVAPGIVDHLHVWRAYGPAPVTAGADAVAPATALTGDYGIREEAEVRTSGTPPSMGVMVHDGDWDGFTRWSFRREIGDVTTAQAGRQQYTLLRLMTDFHTAWLQFVRRPDPATIVGDLLPSDGKLTCSFVLPDDARWRGSVEIASANALNGDDAAIAWANGSTTLRLTRTKLEEKPSCVVPPGVAAAISRSGGVAVVTIAHAKPVDSYDRRIFIHFREQKP